MSRCALGLLLLSACSFSGATAPGGEADAAVDAPIDAPPESPSVRFTTITSPLSMLSPGTYGFQVTATIQNDLGTDLTDMFVTLSFTDSDMMDRIADFRWRDEDRRDGTMSSQPTTIEAGGSADFVFRVDALTSVAGPGPISINGNATFATGGTLLSAMQSETPLSLGFEPSVRTPIVVDTAVDDNGAMNQTSFREALAAAEAAAGPDRIVFDSGVFPGGQPTTMLLDLINGELPTITEDLVIDGRGRAPELAVDAAWSGSALYGLRINSGTVVISGLRFRDMGENYIFEDIDTVGNCGTLMAVQEGGAIRVDDGTLILDNNVFADPNVAERDCFSASVRILGGSGHRIIRNNWVFQTMDAILLNAAAVEISDNRILGNGANGSDDGIIIIDQGGEDLWVVGNLFVDQEHSGIVAQGANAGTLYVINNTFVRNGLTGENSAFRRESPTRQVTLRNNLYVTSNVSAVALDNDGNGVDSAHEWYQPDTYCNPACDAATQSMNATGNPLLTNEMGNTRADFVPLSNSPLINSGENWVDRNGPEPRRFVGAGPDRGAIEAF